MIDFDPEPLLNLLHSSNLESLAEDPRLAGWLEDSFNRAQLVEDSPLAWFDYDKLNFKIIEHLITIQTYQVIGEKFKLGLAMNNFELPDRTSVSVHVDYDYFVRYAAANVEFYQVLCQEILENNYDYEAFKAGVLLLSCAYRMGIGMEFEEFYAHSINKMDMLIVRFAQKRYKELFEGALKANIKPNEFYGYCLLENEVAIKGWERSKDLEDPFIASFALHGIKYFNDNFEELSITLVPQYKEAYAVHHRLN